jgi:hypothetical protein
MTDPSVIQSGGQICYKYFVFGSEDREIPESFPSPLLFSEASSSFYPYSFVFMTDRASFCYP